MAGGAPRPPLAACQPRGSAGGSGPRGWGGGRAPGLDRKMVAGSGGRAAGPLRRLSVPPPWQVQQGGDRLQGPAPQGCRNRQKSPPRWVGRERAAAGQPPGGEAADSPRLTLTLIGVVGVRSELGKGFLEEQI